METSEAAFSLRKLGKRVKLGAQPILQAKKTKILSAVSVAESEINPVEKLKKIPVVRIQPLSEEEIGFYCHPSTSQISQDAEEPSVPIRHWDVLVLEKVFSFLDHESLKNCRLVSHDWNQEASRTLGKRSWFNNSKLECKVLTRRDRSCSCTDTEHFHDQTDLERYAKDTLRLFKNISSSYLAQNVSLVWKDLYNRKYQQLIKTIGPSIKSLQVCKVIEKYGMRNLHNILTKWCPNLSTLKIKMCNEGQEYCSEYPFCTSRGRWRNARLWEYQNERLQFEFKMPLSLTRIEIQTKCSLEYSGTHWRGYIGKIFQSCPSLTSYKFRIDSRWYYQFINRIGAQESQVYGQLPILLEVNQNLREISWDSTENTNTQTSSSSPLNVLKLLLPMNFSSKLKRFGFGPSTSSDEISNLQEFVQVLNKLNRCGVEELLFLGKNMYRYVSIEHMFGTNSIERQIIKLRVCDVPVMSSVKSIKSMSDFNYGLGCIKFVTKFPNLVKLDMTPTMKGVGVDSQKFLEEWEILSRTPHTNLKILIVNPRIKKLSTLHLMMKCFPNLERLYIQARRISFKEAILSTTKSLPHLKELTVKMVSKYKPIDISRALRVVKECQKLQRLTLQGMRHFCRCNMTFSNTKNGFENLSGSSCFVRLVGHKINDSHKTRLETLAAKNKLRVRFLPTPRRSKVLHKIDFNSASSEESDYESGSEGYDSDFSPQ